MRTQNIGGTRLLIDVDDYVCHALVDDGFALCRHMSLGKAAAADANDIAATSDIDLYRQTPENQKLRKSVIRQHVI